MIKRALYSLLVVALMGAVGCSDKKIIPDDTLADIFHDAFVVNAYVGEKRINLDSLRIYEPIVERYGYTTEDVMHTVGNFSRRKSVRLGSIVEEAISKLEEESKELEKKVIILDTIRSVAVRTFKRTIYEDSIIVAKTRADSTRLRIEISPAPRGEYSVAYNYTCGDDLDKYPRVAEFYFADDDGFHQNRTSVTLRERGVVNRTIVSKQDSRCFVLNLGKYTLRPKDDDKGKKLVIPNTQDLKITNLKVHYKLKEEEAVDSLFLRYVDVKIFADGFLIKKDSVALSPDTAGVSASTADND